ncbi:uncharacterized protein LOC127869913 [Dreissena polymorpha]|uniref:uncharacterized protein LOC127869913 n=1 Tax=Dreissena polymorpha TaxID=45954 RepID=UPI002264B386|nr:uncharacterized protein LOC127869913 [Dreissena polymorpha]
MDNRIGSFVHGQLAESSSDSTDDDGSDDGDAFSQDDSIRRFHESGFHIFGMRIDGQSRQLNFLIDENECIGADGANAQGPNAAISMIDYVLNTHGCEDLSCTIHADNCPGQNKNQFVIGYFAWRVLTRRHTSIEYMMQVPGHSRCLVDSGFAHIKKLYRRSDCDTIQQLEDIVDKSSTANEAVRYPTWRWRDWKTFLSTSFKAIPGIRSTSTSGSTHRGPARFSRRKQRTYQRKNSSSRNTGNSPQQNHA